MSRHPRRSQARHSEQDPRAAELERMIHDRSPDVLKLAASHPAMNEDLALALLSRRDVPAAALENLSKNGPAMKHRPVQTALVSHPKTPRHVSLPIARHLYTFELMQIALTPAVPADVK